MAEGRHLEKSKRLMLFALTGTMAIFGRWRHLMPPILLLITNETKLTLTIALTLTDTVAVIFYAHFVDTNKKVVSQ